MIARNPRREKEIRPETKIGKRRTSFEAPPDVRDFDLAETLIEREPMTVVVSQKGWIRAMKGHVADISTAIQGRRRLQTSFFAETTSKILVLASDGKVFTSTRRNCPAGAAPASRSAYGRYRRGRRSSPSGPLPAGDKMLIAASTARLRRRRGRSRSSTPQGRAVLNVDGAGARRVVAPADGDHVAVIGENRKLLVFPLGAAPRNGARQGHAAQRYKDGGISDAGSSPADGLTWRDSAGRSFTVAAELKDWIGNRAEAGRLPPKGFPKNNRFG